MAGRSYRELIVWKKSKDLCLLVYKVTEDFPTTERYGLTSQIRRCSVSIPSNIAEGRYRSTKKEFCRFLYYAFGSGAELETQLYIAKELGYITLLRYTEVTDLLTEVMKMLNALIESRKSS
jgi:four helix bundle protein